LIPDATLKRWIATDPKKHIDLWSQANKDHDGDLVPMIKMLKGWNRYRDVMRSFHLETLALDVFTGITISDFSSGARYFFDKAREKIKYKLADPSGYSDDVAAYISTQAQIDEVVGALERAYTRAKDAEALAAAGKTADAVEKWKLIFGNYFPAYG